MVDLAAHRDAVGDSLEVGSPAEPWGGIVVSPRRSSAMAATTATSPYPLVPIEEESSPDMDYAAHVRTFKVLNTAKWFVAHLLILLIALYFLIIAGQPVTGVFFLCCALALLVYAALRRSSIRADLAKGLGAGPTAPARDTIDATPGLGDRT
jgi:hypothetical protein